MNEIETRFIEQYKETEAELNRRLDTRRGMSDYITQMEAMPIESQLRVPTWRKDYRSLKHLRWLRNRIVHEKGVSECEEFDNIELTDFYRRLLNGSDPLASARRAAAQAAAQREAAQRAARLQADQQSKAPAPAKADEQSDTRCGRGEVAAVIVTVIILLLLFFVYKIGLFDKLLSH